MLLMLRKFVADTPPRQEKFPGHYVSPGLNYKCQLKLTSTGKPRQPSPDISYDATHRIPTEPYLQLTLTDACCQWQNQKVLKPERNLNPNGRTTSTSKQYQQPSGMFIRLTGLILTLIIGVQLEGCNDM